MPAHRFLGLVWDADDAERAPHLRERARRLTEVLTRHPTALSAVHSELGMLFFTTPSVAGRFGTTTLATGGLVVGRVFARGAAAPESIATSDSKGSVLASALWGRYVALVRGQEKKWYVLRDPSGALPCFVARSGEFLCVFSDLRDFLAIHDGRLSVNWAHLGAFLHRGEMMCASTGYEEISQLLPGQRMRLDASMFTDFYWSPRQFCTTGVIENHDDAEVLLRESVLTSVKAWGSCYRNILLELSGGLDSAIVLACLAELRPDVDTVAVNHYTVTSEGDERRYAREVARRQGCELVEIGAPPAQKSFRQIIQAEHLASPCFAIPRMQLEDLQAAFIHENGLEASFSGRGGDQLFYQVVDARTAVEFARRHPLSPQLWTVAMDVAFAARVPVWSVLAEVVRDVVWKRRRDPYAFIERPPFLRESGRAFEHLRHPWLQDDDDLPESKRQQACDIIDCQAFYRGSCSYVERVEPLISQPIFEASLRIPTYRLSHDGISRALIRKCFESRLPRTIFHRTTKGATTGYHRDLLLADLPYIRELTVGGRLVEEGLVDKACVEALVTEERLMRDYTWMPLLGLITAETWLRHAHSRRSP